MIFKEKYEQELMELLIEANAISFGDYTLKTGRQSPFFIHSGAFDNGRELNILAKCYAAAIRHKFCRRHIDVIFGPAYKGIALASAVAMATDTLYGDVIRYSSNRDPKDHGEKGDVLGSEIRDGDRVLIVDDVLTSGTSIYEAVEFLDKHADVEILGAIVAIDRCERSEYNSSLSARVQVGRGCGFSIAPILIMPDIVRYLHGSDIIDEATAMRIAKYYDMYEPETGIPAPTRNI
ncbi:orotate phosphoribosyltransferase [Candidatus Saccharibacteria bacterium]|nr:orotate phosphoribosyltransferase [Candidatus Saccharibacteria bacterium]